MSLFHTASSPVQVPRYTGLQVQTASSALPIPIVYGTTRLAPNLIWNGAFRAFPQYSKTSGGKGGGGHTSLSGYTYATAAVFAIGEGPIAGLGTVWRGGGTHQASDYYLSLYAGATPQQPWGYLSASFPQAALAYQGTAYAATSSFDLGSQASIGTLAFEIIGRLTASAVVNTHDADPALVVTDFLTSPQYGVGFPAANLQAPTGVSGDGSYQSWCRAAGLAFSPCLSDRETAATILQRWLTLTGATAVWSAGRLKLVPLADAAATGTLADGSTASFTPVITPIYDLTDDDFVDEPNADPVTVTRSDPYAAPNVQRLEILDRGNAYSPTPVEARDQNALDLYGARPGSAVTAHEICDLTVGRVSAQLILARGLYLHNHYAFRLSWDCCLLEPMDVVTLTDANLGLAKTPVRITAIAETADGLLDVTAEELPGTLTAVAGLPVAGAVGAPLDRNVAPAPVNTPVIFEPPPELTGDSAQVWIGLSGGRSGVADPNWGGATVYVSTDNATYTAVGTVSAPAHQGVLAAALGAADATASISLAASGAVLGLAAGGPPLSFWIDGEIVAAASATLTAASTYQLGGLTRRLYGQRGGAHTAGAAVLALNSAVFRYAVPTNAIGQPLWLKFASFNLFGGAAQDLSICTAYPITPIGSGLFGPVAQALAVGTPSDDGLASGLVNEVDNFGLASDPYTEAVDMGLASDGAQALALGAGGTGAVAAAQARANLGAAATGANADISSLTNLTGIGIGTSVDTTVNLFSMKSAAALFDNAGGSVALAVNKAAVASSASHVFQTGYSARAQAGLLGSDRYRISVSAAGTSFTQALDIDPTTGHIGLSGYTNNRVQVHDGTTPGGWPAAKLADVTQRTAVADANYTVLPTDRIVAYTALSASRIVTLPAASAYPTGTQLLFVDETGACSPVVVITIARSGTDTINGLPSALVSSAYGFLALTSNGKSAWTAVDFSGATTAQLTNRNAIINGNFAINQRGYASGTALSAGSYAHDRFKAGSSGCAYAFTQAVPDTIVTITAGSLLQVIEGANLFSSTMWLTWTGTASARVYQGTASSQTNPPYAAGMPATISGTAVNMLAVSGLTVGSNTIIEFTGGSIGLVQCEVALPNAGPTRFERRYGELALCQRYYQKSYDPGIAPGTIMGNGACTVNANAPSGSSAIDFVLPVVMRATPTATILDGTATAGKVSYYGNSGWTGGGTPSVIYPHPQRLFVQTNIAGSYQVNFDYVLSAEI